MSKNYNEVSSQVAAVRTKDHTLAFYANLESVKLENFAELISGRIKVGINDFSKGKGDASVYGYYNLDLKDVKYLYTRALYSNMPVPFEGRKIHGAYPIQEGPDRGMCRAFHITIKRNALRPDGQPSRSPWNITISNGVAQAQSGGIEGTFFEKSGTFKQTAYVYMNLTDVDFLDCMDRLNTYIREYTRLSADKLIPEGIKALKEVYERSSYQASATPQTDGQQAQRQYTEQQTPPPAQYQVQSQQTQTVQTPQPTQPAQTPLSARQSTPELHPTTLLIQSTFQALEGGKSIAQCMVKGRTYNVFFDFMSNELIEAQIMAAIGLRQLDRYPGMLERRKEIVAKYDAMCDELGVKHLIHSGENFNSSHHLYLTRIPGISDETRREIIIKLAERGVNTNVHYKPLPMMTAYKTMGWDIKDFPNAYAYYENLITLPLHTKLSDEDVEYVIENYKEVVGEYIS